MDRETTRETPVERWCQEAPDDRIGILYRVVRIEQYGRTIMAYARRSLFKARRRAIYEANELVDLNVADDEPVLLDDDTGLRVLVGGDPVDFIVEEDTFDGDTDWPNH